MAVSPSTRSREAGSPQPVRRRFGRRPSLSHVLIAIVVILAFVLNLLVLQDRGSTALVAVADEPIAAGTVLEGTSLRLVPVDSSFEALPALVQDGDLGSIAGWVTTRSIPAGSPIQFADLVESESPTGLRSMSLPVSPEHAAGGLIAAGDRVDVLSVRDGVPAFVATDLEVISVAEGAAGSIGGLAAHHLVVAVDPDQALDLAQALDSGSIEILRSTGAEPIGADDGS